MTIFAVLEPPDGKPDRVDFVPEGFSWGALLFTVVWALWHRMWMVAALLFALTSVLTVATSLEVLGPNFAALLHLGIAVIFAFEARNLEVKSLERAGFRRAGLIEAGSCEGAELAYFADRASVPPQPAPSRVQAVQDDTLGIFGKV
ncbi:MAG: DUF2628 domain-containing protein [Hyphomicrobiales bacterium]|uniref:DUF2628 domain-containing protein n=1 Tax=Aestuariivirga sp. TaxID=2650926 RepID=UPI0035B4D653